MAWKDTHARVSKSVHEVEPADEHIGNPQEQQVLFFQQSPRVPCDHEDATGDDNAEYLSETVKEEVTMQARQVEAQQD